MIAQMQLSKLLQSNAMIKPADKKELKLGASFSNPVGRVGEDDLEPGATTGAGSLRLPLDGNSFNIGNPPPDRPSGAGGDLAIAVMRPSPGRDIDDCFRASVTRPRTTTH
ncbi:hypothetical protein HDU96_001623 [Phlyctochytrium bullatum]|nr:hypothetical protein HDU96_001623 [Phlyctochytrium bullatum]